MSPGFDDWENPVPLHWRILIGMALGLLAGVIAVWVGGDDGKKFVVDWIKPFRCIRHHPAHRFWSAAFWQNVDWIKPFGTIFINALKVIAVPLIVASLIKGISDLKEISKLSQMGGRTIGLYLITTTVAVTLGLLIASVVGPGRGFDEQTRANLVEASGTEAQAKVVAAEQQKEQGPLQPLVDLVPENLVASASNNRDMLKVIVFTLCFGVGLLLVDPDKARPVKEFFDGLNEVVLKLIDLIMFVAPIGVFALLAALVAEVQNWDFFIALVVYSLCVFFGLCLMTFGFYPMLVQMFTGMKYTTFFKGIAPAQLLAFSTSSSAATLPVTMERVEEHLGVDEEVSSFVLPIGATINMDGTSLYQAVAAVFIAQAYGVDLTFGQYFTVAMTAILASIGTAAVPSAGIVMLVIVLEQIRTGLGAGIALVIGVDRVLDMCRTVVNITSDATVAMLVAKGTGKLGPPHERKWDDHYHPGADSSEAEAQPAGESIPPQKTPESTEPNSGPPAES